MKYATKINPSFVANYEDAAVPWGPVGYITYKRTYSRRLDERLTEEWYQTVERCCNGLLKINGAFTQDEIQGLYDHVFNLRCNFSGRALWQLGTETVDRLGGDSLQNCWTVGVNTLDAFTFTFNELMLGGGVGFNITPEFVYELPVVKHTVSVERVDSFDCDFIVTDNREGWVELLHRIMKAFFTTGKPLRYCTRGVRDKGSLIRGFGGIASGAEDLVWGMGQIVLILQGAHGRKLKPVECLDIMNIIGAVVVSGNVRRSAELALGSPTDREFLQAKNWSRFKVPSWRRQSNNSVDAKSVHDVLPEFWDAYEGQGEAYGLINLDLARRMGRLADGEGHRPDPGIIAFNPCITKDAWVHTADGPKQVKELMGKPFLAAVDREVYDSSPKGFFATGVKPVFLVETIEGYSFKVTGDHEIKKVLTTANSRYVNWRALTTLDPGDKISLHNHRGLRWAGEGTYGEGWLLGSLQGDGSFTDEGRNAYLEYWGSTAPVMEAFASNLLTQTFACRPDTKLGSTAMARRARKLGMGPEKTLDCAIERTSYEFHRAFLSGWFDADGSVCGDLAKGLSVRLHCSILPNLYVAQRMLARLGIISTVYPFRRDSGGRMMPDGKGGSQMYHCEASHDLVIANDNIKEFRNVVGFVDPEKASLLDERLGSYRRGLNRERFTARISAITLVGEEEVFDCTIPGPAEFDGNGANLHNCAEQGMEDREACNLFELYLSRLRDLGEFVEASELGYMAVKTISTLPFIDPKTQAVVARNHRLGVGVTGYCASDYYGDAASFDAVYDNMEQKDKRYSRLIGCRESIKLTTVKPSGTSSLLPGVPPGVHPEFADHYIRRITFAANNPLVDLARDSGFAVEPMLNLDGSYNYGSMIVDFPVKARDGAIMEHQLTAVDQLNNQLFLQTHWSDSAVSMTCYYKPEELPEIQDWLSDHYEDEVKTCSFLRHQGHGFKQAPYERISPEQYAEMADRTTPITRIADCAEVETDSLECASGACPTR